MIENKWKLVNYNFLSSFKLIDADINEDQNKTMYSVQEKKKKKKEEKTKFRMFNVETYGLHENKNEQGLK